MISIAAIKTGVISTINTGKRFIIKHSPEILMGVGVVSIVGGTVLACKATPEAVRILDDLEYNLSDIPDAKNDKDEADRRKIIVTTYISSGVEMVMNYAPAVCLEALGITSVLCAYGIVRKRNIALIGAYTTLEGIFNDYRGRVVSELGEKADFKFLHGYSDDAVVEEEDGIKTITGIVPTEVISGYARIFDEYNPNWHKCASDNRFFLAQQQAYFNNLLKVQGHVFLNEVYDALGFSRTAAGAIVGWVLDGPDSDNFIDFGIYNILPNCDTSESRIEFINARTPSVMLDFNVDGVIYDLI